MNGDDLVAVSVKELHALGIGLGSPGWEGAPPKLYRLSAGPRSTTRRVQDASLRLRR